MKNILNYQTSEYDCGPVSLTNAIRYLFDREIIYPDIIKYIMLYCLDLEKLKIFLFPVIFCPEKTYT